MIKLGLLLLAAVAKAPAVVPSCDELDLDLHSCMSQRSKFLIPLVLLARHKKLRGFLVKIPAESVKA